MDIDLLFKKTYTVSFRLTGEEQVAEKISSQAIVNTLKKINEDYKEKATENILQLTVIELIKIFLDSPNLNCNDDLKGIQKSLLELKPVNRAVIIWKDVLGFKIHDSIPISDYTYEELYNELVCGRKDLKDLNLKYLNKLSNGKKQIKESV